MLPPTPNYEEPHLCLPSCINSLRGTSASRSASSSACTLMRFRFVSVLIRLFCESVGTFSDSVGFCRPGVRSVRLDRSPDSNMSALAERTIEMRYTFRVMTGVVEADLAQVFTAFLFRMGGVAT